MSDATRPPVLPPFPPEYRASGLLLHITSLPSPSGIGDVGTATVKWIDQLHAADKAGGRFYRWVRRDTATLRINDGDEVAWT